MRLARRNEHGLASLVIVSVLIVLITLVSVGFAKIMSRAQHNALNNQLGVAASYAAQSGINDAISYLKANPSASASKCSDLSGNSAFANSNLSGDGTTAYTCVLISQNPPDLLYQQLPPDGSQIVKATTADSVDQLMFSWQSTNRSKTAQPSGANPTLQDATSWNSAGYTPLLRVSLYPIPSNGQLSGVEAASKTFFFYPTNAGGIVTKIPYATADGTLQTVNCGTQNVSGFTGSADYDCNVIINGMSSAGASYFYLRATPIYGEADIKVQANADGNKVTTFTDAQAVVDVTGKSGTAVKRLEARVDISSVNSTVSGNISASDNAAPEFALRQAAAICKRLNVQPETVTVDSSYCNLTVTPPPPPDVTLEAPTNITTSSATLNGTVNPNGHNVTACHFDYGTTANYGSSVNCSPSPGAGNSPISVSANISGLNGGTTYYYQLCATNVGDTTCKTNTTGTNNGGNGGGSGDNGSGGLTTKPVPPTASLSYNGTTGSNPNFGLSFNVSCGNSSSASINLNPASHGGGARNFSVSTSGPANIGDSLQYGDSGSATLTCTGTGGSASKSASWSISVPQIILQVSQVVAGHYGSPPGDAGQTCHDGVHYWLICVSWRVHQDGYDRFDFSGCRGQSHSSVPSFGDSGWGNFGAPLNGSDSDDGYWTYWVNRTWGWGSGPGTISVTIQCFGAAGSSATASTSPDYVGGDTGTGGGGQGGPGGSGGGTTQPPPTQPPPTYSCTHGGTSSSPCVTCWDGSSAVAYGNCPAKPPTYVTCTHGGQVTSPPGCSTCWDGTTAIDFAHCPAQPVCKKNCFALSAPPQNNHIALEGLPWRWLYSTT